MELHVNKIELVGRIGQVRVNEYNDKKVANFSVITEIFIKKQGAVISESTWHSCTAWEGHNIADFSLLQPGSLVRVTGRIRNTKYTDAYGNDKTYTEVLATSLITLPREG